ncbi:hypothetical protein FIM25_14610 [Desulfobotulus mexicanus]|uniref:Uncharacterized protein n=1 Tax=Desulfobotulus mexicanus TaxID=2586642 RepID=A0A5S5MCW3_9BACT|nr:hypothetical protein FIM25_14610 [Desulfobotulus mexicanus]
MGQLVAGVRPASVSLFTVPVLQGHPLRVPGYKRKTWLFNFKGLGLLWLKDNDNQKNIGEAFLGMDQRSKLLNTWHESCNVICRTKGRLRKTKE